MHTISLVNQKGGVGKTTTAVCLARALVQSGHAVLLLDLDLQMNATKWMLGRELQQNEASILDSIITVGDESAGGNDWPLARLVEPSELGFDFVPAHTDLANIEGEIGEKPSRPYLLRERIRELKEGIGFEHLEEAGAHLSSSERYDFCLVDCPPSLGLLVVQALTASDALLVPVHVDGMSMQGLGQLVNTTREVRKYLNGNVELLGLLPSNLDLRAGLVNEGLDALRKTYEELVFDTVIPWRSKIIEVSTYGTTLYDHAPSSDAVMIYEKLAEEVTQRLSAQEASLRVSA